MKDCKVLQGSPRYEVVLHGSEKFSKDLKYASTFTNFLKKVSGSFKNVLQGFLKNRHQKCSGRS